MFINKKAPSLKRVISRRLFVPKKTLEEKVNELVEENKKPEIKKIQRGPKQKKNNNPQTVVASIDEVAKTEE
jgi:hypothetical protein